MRRHLENKEVTGESQRGFTRGKSCLANSVAFHGGATALVDRGRADLSTWTCAKHLALPRVTPLSLNWGEMDMMDELQQVSHETAGIQTGTEQEEEQ